MSSQILFSSSFLLKNLCSYVFIAVIFRIARYPTFLLKYRPLIFLKNRLNGVVLSSDSHRHVFTAENRQTSSGERPVKKKNIYEYVEAKYLLWNL